MKKTFIWLSVIYCVSLIAILRANFDYIDDMGRVLTGSKGWSFYSRFVTDFLSTFIHADNYLSDISPLTQIMAALIMALAGAVSVEILADDDCSPFWGAVSMIPLALSPYFLQCFSYKYDSPYMAMSVLFSVAPVLVFIKHTKKYRFCVYTLSALAGTLLVCTTYQAASGIFPMLCIAYALKMWNEKVSISHIVKFVLCSVAGYLLALIVFRLFIVIPVDFYASTDLVSVSSFIPSIFKNLTTYFGVILADFRSLWLLVIAVICVLFIFANIIKTKRSRLAAIFLSLTCLLLMAIVSFGAYLALSKPLFDPRGMYGFGAFIAFLSVSVVCINKPYIKYSRYACAVLGWMFIVFAFTYGNALSQQKDYTEFRISQVVNSLNSLDVMDNGKTKTIEISGTEGYAPAVEHQPSQYRMLRDLVPVLFSEDRSWGYTMLLNNYGLSCLEQHPEKDLAEMDLPVLVDNQLHTIKGDDENILIILK